MSHIRKSKLSELVIDAPPVVTVPMREPDPIEPDLLDIIQAMSRPRRHAFYALLCAELAAVFGASRPRQEQVIFDRVTADGEALARDLDAQLTVRARNAAKTSAAQQKRAERDAALMTLYDEGYSAKSASAEVGCSYGTANSVRQTWMGRREKQERDHEAAVQASRREAGIVDDAPKPAKELNLAELADIIRQGNIAFGFDNGSPTQTMRATLSGTLPSIPYGASIVKTST